MVPAVERFAPSPTGYLHLGHAYSAFVTWSAARRSQGTMHLRIEDIDRARSRPAYTEAILADLAWLGIKWCEPIMYQSDRLDAHRDALAALAAAGLCYPCRCTRRDINAALRAPHGLARQTDSVGSQVYPGTCRGRAMSDQQPGDAVRLNMPALIAALGGPDSVSQLTYREIGDRYRGVHQVDADALLATLGDVVLARGDIGTSYHLGVVVDDAAMGITHVTRGEDLFPFTALHRVLLAALKLPPPLWRHHLLISDAAGKRLAKRDDARSLRSLRAAGWQAEELLERMAGVTPETSSMTLGAQSIRGSGIVSRTGNNPCYSSGDSEE